MFLINLISYFKEILWEFKQSLLAMSVFLMREFGVQWRQGQFFIIIILLIWWLSLSYTALLLPAQIFTTIIFNIVVTIILLFISGSFLNDISKCVECGFDRIDLNISLGPVGLIVFIGRLLLVWLISDVIVVARFVCILLSVVHNIIAMLIIIR